MWNAAAASSMRTDGQRQSVWRRCLQSTQVESRLVVTIVKDPPERHNLQRPYYQGPSLRPSPALPQVQCFPAPTPESGAVTCRFSARTNAPLCHSISPDKNSTVRVTWHLVSHGSTAHPANSRETQACIGQELRSRTRYVRLCATNREPCPGERAPCLDGGCSEKGRYQISGVWRKRHSRKHKRRSGNGILVNREHVLYLNYMYRASTSENS